VAGGPWGQIRSPTLSYNCSVILQGFHIFWLCLVFFPVGDMGAQHLSCVSSPPACLSLTSPRLE